MTTITIEISDDDDKVLHHRVSIPTEQWLRNVLSTELELAEKELVAYGEELLKDKFRREGYPDKEEIERQTLAHPDYKDGAARVEEMARRHRPAEVNEAGGV